MHPSQMDFLSAFGWDGFFESHRSETDFVSFLPARVIGEERGLYRVQVSLERSLWASVSGKMQFNAIGREDFPAVGDWVSLQLPEGSDRGVIQSFYPRKSLIQRKQAGLTSEMQILSTNIDTVFVTTSMNADLNDRRLERYLSVAWDSGAVPVILLTKADLHPYDQAEIAAGVADRFPGVDVRVVSQENFSEAIFFAEYLRAGQTAVVLGSSGVGKSTLVNFLIGRDQIKTQEVREDDEKGRHTTTARSLYRSIYGGLIIDTPGMRELQLTDQEDGLKTQFSDVEELIKSCRFGDCQHATEPGCAVKEALADGGLSAVRWENFQKLQAEIRFGLRKQDKAVAAEEKKRWKKLTEQGRLRGRMKRGEE